ncbi:MAG: tyrosine--tRNA ligase [Planctomycetota bacterium]
MTSHKPVGHDTAAASGSDLIAELEARGLLKQATPHFADAVRTGPQTAYVGFDPTGASLHVGSLVPVLTLARLQRAGHHPIALVGGGTGLIGDPSGKAGERTMLAPEQVAAHVASLRAQLERFLDFDGPRPAQVLDNSEWLSQVGLLDFLRDVGKHFTVNQMVVRDSVRPRLEDPDRSISFTEFTYMLLQAYDYLVLHDRHGCSVQLGASDQWGNIVSGCDLIRRRRETTVHGFTHPLVTKADGTKFGKTEQGAVWLDATLTPGYEFYQFWRNTPDDVVGQYLRYFTFLPLAKIAEIERAQQENPQAREAQRVLAAEVTELVHGAEVRQRAEHTTAVLFGPDWRELSAIELEEAFAHSPRTQLARDALGTDAAKLVVVVADTELAKSRGQARQAIRDGAISVNNEKRTDPEAVLSTEDLLAGRFLVLRRGKKTYHVVEVP